MRNDAKSRQRRPRRVSLRLRGFTLLEVLVAMFVLTLLFAIVAQMVNSAMTLSQREKLNMDAVAQVRAVFDRMALDFGGLVKRGDVDCIFSKTTGNDAIFFYSEAPAYFASTTSTTAKSSAALVGYRVNTSYQLERLGKGLTWTGVPSETSTGGIAFLIYASGSDTTPKTASTLSGRWGTVVGSSPYTMGSDSAYHLLSDGVFRMEFCFLTTSGTYSKPSANFTAASGTSPLLNVAAVVVTIAVLDDQSRKTIDIDILEQIADALEDGGASNSDHPEQVAEVWNQKINELVRTNTLGVPTSTLAKVRVFQRAFYINPPITQ